MPRILVAECIHEVCSFNPTPTRYEDFAVLLGEEVMSYHVKIGSEIGGALRVFSEHAEVEVIPTFGARGITSGGVIARADFDRLAGQFLDGVKNVPTVDGIYFALHGAMAADGEDDPEGYLLAETRKIVGEQVPIVASFDLHGVLTARMLEQCNAIVVYHTYPHVDFFETGQRSARLLLRILAGKAKPVTACVRIPALVRGDELMTESGVFGEFVREATVLEQAPGGLSAGLFIGNPFTDVPDLASYAFVCTDGDAAGAERGALALAGRFWEQREQMQARLTGLLESVKQAADSSGIVILVDAADATSSGAPGDSNAILSELMAAGYRGRVLVPIVDPAAVSEAFVAGVGTRIRTQVGGACDRRVQPVEIDAVVRLLSDGRFRSESFGQDWYSGRTGVLQAENITLVVTSRPVHLFDRSLFWAHGQDPRHFDLVVVKSPHCQPHMFADWCGKLINVDAPGATSANLRSLGHSRCGRPMFPLDDTVTFKPAASLFARCKWNDSAASAK